MAELDPAKLKRAKALKMKMDLEAQAAPREEYKPASPTTAESSWFETLGNTAKNAPGSAMNVVRGLVDVVTHPTEAVEGIRRLDRGSRQLLESMFEEKPETPELATARKFVEGVKETIKHPAIAASNDPAGILMDIFGLKGIGGKALRIADAPTDLPRLIQKSRDVSEAAFGETNKLGKTDISNIIPEVRRAAEGAGYDPRLFPPQAQARPGLAHVLKTFEQPKTVLDPMLDPRTIRNIRGKEGGLEDLGQNVGTLSRDDCIIMKAKGAFDEGVKRENPAVAEAIAKENEAYSLYKTNRGLADMLTSGKLRGALRGEDAAEIKKNITKAITNARTRKGYGNIEDELTDLVTKTPNSVGLMRAMLTQSGASSATGALLGSQVAGPMGAVVGGMAGASVPPLLRLRKNAKAARVIERDLTNLIREINGLPPAQRALRIKQLSPGERAALVSAGAIGQDR